MTGPTRVRATTPGSIGNIGPGLDVLGCALAGPRDEVVLEWSAKPGIVVRDAGHRDLPSAPDRHAAAIAAGSVLDRAVRSGVVLPAPGLAISARKGLPLSGGQGGSAASAVAGAAAANALLGNVLETDALLHCCLDAEARVSARHLDNIAPALLGGIVAIRSVDPVDIVKLAAPPGLRIVLAHPAMRLSTSRARAVLPASIPRDVVIHQLAQVAAIVAACATADAALFGRAIDDRIAEPARAPLLPGFAEAKRAALEAGALGASISGAGPTAFAVVDDEQRGETVAVAMRDAYAAAGMQCTTRVTEVDTRGTVVSVLA
jgi:homoserine kinase